MSTGTEKNLTRHVFAYYLLFCLMSLISLGVGVAVVSYRSSVAAFDDASMVMISAAESRFTIATIVSENAGSQTLAEQLAHEHSLDYCAIVSPDGSYVVHSNHSLVGKVHGAPLGTRSTTGKVEKIVTREAGRTSTVEYSVPLEHGGNNYGTLLVARAKPTAWQNLQSITTELPLALIVPALFLVIGAIFIYRSIKPVAGVHDQLSSFAAAPSIYSLEFRHLPVSDSMTVGWNALVDELKQHVGDNDFDRKLEDIIQSRQSNVYAQTLDSLPDGVAETDHEGKITFINNAMAALLGVDAKDTVFGQQFDRFFDANFEATSDSDIFNKSMYSRASVAEVSRATPIGDRVLRVARNPISTESERSSQVWSVRDITQQKIAQKAHSEFLDSATHELRTPLANIRAYAETLELCDVLEIEQQKQFCNTINSEATRLARFIDELLDVSSIEAGSMQVKKQNVEIQRMLVEVVGKVQPLMESKQIEFETLFAEKLPELPVDKDKFATCLVNLLGNAAKYTPDGGSVVFRATTAGNQFVIEVEDTGIGIGEEEISSVFDKFFRSKDRRVHNETGTGLGLAFASEVARLHGATLSVESELNVGSTFTLSMPMPRKANRD